jgi:VWFA-related protein/TonB family protein
MTHFHAKRLLKKIPHMGVLWLGILFCSQVHGNPAPQSDTDADRLKIKVGVDCKGKQVPDLTADDFEVYQDDSWQEITSCRYISQDRSSSVEKQATVQDPVSLIPAPRLKREDVQRAIVALVHDYGMEFEDVYRTRMALRKYVNEQMQPGDLLSIFKTSRGSATLQAFSSDKRGLLARIENIQWKTSFMQGKDWVEYGYDPKPVYPGAPLDAVFDSMAAPPTINRMPWDEKIQLDAVEYCIKALEDMTGRKYILLITPIDGTYSYGNSYDRILDAALRSNIVIHTLNIKGLPVGDVIKNVEGDPVTGRMIITENIKNSRRAHCLFHKDQADWILVDTISSWTEWEDTIEACRWLSLFIDRMKDKPNPSVQKAKDVRDSLAGKMTPQQREEAQKLVEESKSAQFSSPKPSSGNVLKSKLIKRVDPVYPVEAKRMRLSGMVILVVTVDEEGNVEDVHVTRGHPELADAAVEAVRQWKYSPTLLEGEPIRVTATVTVNFMLGR